VCRPCGAGHHECVTSLRLPIDVRSVAVARAVLRQMLREDGTMTQRDAPTDAAGDAALMLSELVTNAVRHTRSLLLLEITIDGDTLHIAVVDDALGLPTLRDPDQHAASGRGLKIVDALADRWGFTPDTNRKTVWFDIALS
jgi:anti-sigma regulatory factor (Ser/Thr protein kinase)